MVKIVAAASVRKHGGLPIARQLRRAAVRLAVSLAAGLSFAAPGTVWAQPSLQLAIEAGSHNGPIRRIALDRTEQRLFTVSDDKTARMWDMRTGALLRIFRPPLGAGAIGRLYGVAVHPEKPLIAVGGTTGATIDEGSIYLFDTGSGRLVRRIDLRAGHVRDLAWTPDGALLVACLDGRDGIKAFSESGEPALEEAYAGRCAGLSAGPQGTLLAVSRNGEVHAYRTTGQRIEKTAAFRTEDLSPVAVRLAPDGERFAVAYFYRPGIAGDGTARTAVRSNTSSDRPPVIEVRSLADGRIERRLSGPAGLTGNLMRVAWSRDGRLLYAGGTGYRSGNRFTIFAFDASDRVVGETVVGNDSVLDLVPLRASDLLYASFDGAWGIVRPDLLERRHAAHIADLRGAGSLLLGGDGARVGWSYRFGEDPAWFDFERRTLQRGRLGDAQAAMTRKSLFTAAADWENHFQPRINNQEVAMEPGDVSRAIAYLPDTSDSVLASARWLQRLDSAAKPRWRQALDTEARAVNLTADGALVVTAMADGTIRWWRAEDGMHLLSLFPALDGRWVAWTPTGHYDVGPGAEDLVGWVVSRGADVESDFYTIGRFRDRYYRPELIDRVLRTRNPVQAMAETHQAASADPTPGAPALATQAPQAFEMPPALMPTGSTDIEAAQPDVELVFTVRATAGSSPVFQARLDGRPAVQARFVPPRMTDGRDTGRVALPVPLGESLVQLFARDERGVSEPLEFKVVRRASAGGAASAELRPRGRLFVAAVGVSKYRRSDYDLAFAAKDARDFIETVRARSAGLYGAIEARLLVDAQATRASVLDSLAWLRQSVGPHDTGILFLAGHGINDASDQYYFIPHDGIADRPRTTAVSSADVRASLSSMLGRSVLMVDTCYAGAIADAQGARRATTRVSNELSAPESGVAVFSSSTGRQLSVEKTEWQNGAFTRALTDGLRGEAVSEPSALVTLRALDPFVTRQVRLLTRDFQTPVLVMPRSVPDITLGQGRPDG